MKKKHFRVLGILTAALMVLVSAAPFLYVFLQSTKGDFGKFTLLGYYDVYIATPDYLDRFLISLALCAVIVAGQLIVSVLGGYGFAKCRFPGRQFLFFVLMMVMILPLQVTLVPNYITLDKMQLLNTYAALILPMIFAPLGTFIMTQSFKAVPDVILEAARLDGANLFRILTRVLLPMNISGVVCTVLLCFLDGWNMVEQPVTYLKDMSRYPLSVALAYAPPKRALLQLVCCGLVIMPPLFLFSYFNKELVEGITLAEVKE